MTTQGRHANLADVTLWIFKTVAGEPLQKLSSRLLQFYSGLSKTAVVGTTATVIDLVALAAMVQWLGMTPQVANLPSLFAGSLVQFLGNRYYSFKGGRTAAIHKQAAGFFIAEGISFSLNALIFHLLVTYTIVNFAIARPLGAGFVFLTFSYPVWKFMFDRR